MAQIADITMKLFASGYCMADQKIINPTSGKGQVKFNATWALLSIPAIGYVLFDTGYTDYFNQATQHFPNKLYRIATPVYIQESQTAKSLLASHNIRVDEIRYVIISHFHADHIAGLKDFISATYICTQSALDEVHALRGWRAVKKGIIHDLLPMDFFARTVTIEKFCDAMKTDENGLVTYTLFNNNQFVLYSLPGHARGMLGFAINTENQKILYATDASWSNDTYDAGILPNQIVRLFFDSWVDYKDTLQKIKSFEKANSAFTILFTHSQTTLSHIENEI